MLVNCYYFLPEYFRSVIGKSVDAKPTDKRIDCTSQHVSLPLNELVKFENLGVTQFNSECFISLFYISLFPNLYFFGCPINVKISKWVHFICLMELFYSIFTSHSYKWHMADSPSPWQDPKNTHSPSTITPPKWKHGWVAESE